MMTNILGMLIAAVAIVPAPREQVWRAGTCTFAEENESGGGHTPRNARFTGLSAISTL